MIYFSKILILTFFLQFQSALSLVGFQSLEPLEIPDPYWGLKLIPESVDTRNISFSKGITFCGRFYFHRFPSYLKTLVKMGPQELTAAPESLSLNFLVFFIGYPMIYLGGIWFVINEDRSKIWHTNTWQHICLAFDRKNLHVTLIIVSLFRLSITSCTDNI